MQQPPQDPMNLSEQSSPYSQSDQLSAPPPPLPSSQGSYPPGEEAYYNQLPQVEGPITQYRAGLQGKLDGPPKSRNGWRTATVVLFVLVLILAATSATLIATHTSSSSPVVPQPTSVATQIAQQPTSTVANGAPTSAATSSSTAAAPSTALVASGTITENLLLTCGANCNDPIRVTITTIQVNDAGGNMTWNISLKNVSGNSLNYGVGDAYVGDAFELLANGTQNQIPANFAQSTGTLPNSDPVIIQGIFAFVPTQNTTYTLTVAITAAGQAQITFDPVQITNL